MCCNGKNTGFGFRAALLKLGVKTPYRVAEGVESGKCLRSLDVEYLCGFGQVISQTFSLKILQMKMALRWGCSGYVYFKDSRSAFAGLEA